MDIATIIGIIGGLGLILGAIILGGDFMSFYNLPGLMIVIGGTLMTTLMTQNIKIVLRSFIVAMNAFIDRSDSVEKLIASIVKMSKTASQKGFLALESIKIENKHLSFGIQMLVDGIDNAEIVRTLEIRMESLDRRHETGQKVFRFMASVAPAMGMIGTLIGLIQMLKNLSDPDLIGPAMAVALLTTFYGAVMAFVIFKPIVEKLEERTINEKEIIQIVLTGVDGIYRGMSRITLEEKLNTYLSHKPNMKKKK